MNAIELDYADCSAIRHMVMAFRDKVEFERKRMIEYGRKETDPEIEHMDQDIKEANRVLKLLFKREFQAN